jgi:hypothetical protein
MRSYRYRQCMKCHTILPASSLISINIDYRNPWHTKGGTKRRCPKCHATGYTKDFPIINSTDIVTNFYSQPKAKSETGIYDDLF